MWAACGYRCTSGMKAACYKLQNCKSNYNQHYDSPHYPVLGHTYIETIYERIYMKLSILSNLAVLI